MRKNIAGIVLLICLLFVSMVSHASDQNPILKADTLAAVYIDAAQLFEVYSAQVADLRKPENKDNLAAIEAGIKQHVPGEFSLSDFFQKTDEFVKAQLFVPDGAIWFSIDSSYRPFLSFKAKVKPLELLEFIENRFGKGEPVPVKKEKDLVEFEIPTPEFKISFALRTDGIYLQAQGEPAIGEPSDKWKDMLQSVADKESLMVAEVDLNNIKALVGRLNSQASHSACFTNIRILSAAIEMYAMDKEGQQMQTLDQKELLAAHYLNDELHCPAQGVYSIDASGEVVCAIHGSIKKPLEISAGSGALTSIPAQFRPFENLKIKVFKSRAEIATLINDKNLREQCVALGKQQLLTARNIAENQMGQLPEAEKQKSLKILDSIKIMEDGQSLKVSLTGVDEKTIIAGVAGFIGTMSAIAIPNFQRARESARAKACGANRRVLAGATEMYEMDTGKTMKELDISTLENEKYLKSAPVCPDGGKYSLRRDSTGIMIDCSIHGAE
ncbi:MAG: hypothetical protein PHV05_03095 [Candidatus Riflebacteria bacterium]|nr:hypothetical protein [Candidatus Riflebacteria bacterium]